MGLFVFNDTATTEIYTLSLHDALPIWVHVTPVGLGLRVDLRVAVDLAGRRDQEARAMELREPERVVRPVRADRSEEHTSELQSRQYLVCRLLLEKKKTRKT